MAPDERLRYSRQIVFEKIGEAGQERLARARVAIVGCGALGTTQAGLLARAGVGFLRLIDRDYVELVNLHRQWLYDESMAAEALPKAIGAARRLQQINSTIRIEPVVADLTPGNVDELLGQVDLILDGTDNFETRYLINDYAVRESRPWIYGAALGSYGLLMPIVPGHTPCFRCVYPDPPVGAQPTCETAGVLNTVTTIVGALQANLALKILVGEPVAAELVTLDAWEGSFRRIVLGPPRADCPCCAERHFHYLEASRRAPITLCGRNAVQIHERNRPVPLRQLARQLEPLGKVLVNDFALRFFVDRYEITVFPDGRAIIKGTTDPGLARSLYARYVGS